MKPHQAIKDKTGLSEEDIASFLDSTPDFFTRHPSLLLTMKIDHDSRGALSLVEYQIQQLRKHGEKLEKKLLSLVDTARENEILSLRIHRFSQALIAAESIEDVISTTNDQLRNEFKTESVNVALFPEIEAQVVGDLSLETVTEIFPTLFKSRRPYSGTMDQQQSALLFNGNSEQVKSAAIVPLFETKSLGFLALGSSDKSRFQPGMGDLFLGYLGELVSCALTHHQRIARS